MHQRIEERGPEALFYMTQNPISKSKHQKNLLNGHAGARMANAKTNNADSLTALDRCLVYDDKQRCQKRQNIASWQHLTAFARFPL